MSIEFKCPECSFFEINEFGNYVCKKSSTVFNYDSTPRWCPKTPIVTTEPITMVDKSNKWEYMIQSGSYTEAELNELGQ